MSFPNRLKSSPPPQVILYPELITHKNIAFKTYKKFVDKKYDQFRGYYTELAEIILKKNKRIDSIRTTKTPVTYYFNDMGEFSSVRLLRSPRYNISNKERIMLNPQFDQMMKDHGIVKLMDYYKEENQDVINLCWSMVSSDPFPLKFAEQSLEADLREMKEKNDC